MRGINAEVLEGHAPTSYSYTQAAEKCGAMASAMQRGGRDVTYPVWLLALATAKHAIEGEVFAHQISEGHDDYDEAETDAKLQGLNGGPPGCEAWAEAYGPNGPCNRCDFKGQLKNPAVQLGKVVDVAPAVVAEGEPAAAIPGTPQAQIPQWVVQMNERYALVRIGGKIQAADFFTPSVGAHGVTYGLGFLDLAALRATHAGQYAPIEKVGQKAQPLVQAWLYHKQRRAYEGLAFAPGEALPSDMLNLWTGFAAQPQAGDVSPWLELLDALIPDSQTRAYVLRWFAWKVQNPGGVPGTVLILTGPKGSGKNSLAEIVMGLFGAHGMLAADPEMIAGRFTIHLMDKALVVVDEAVFSGDAASMDRLKARVTGTTLSYEGKGLDPVTGVNRAAYVMLTNHTHVWQSSVDERRAVVCEVSGGLCGQFDFWARYHAWVKGPGPGVLLHYLQGFDLSGFNVRAIPKTEALRKQTELTALRDPVVSWWHQVLSEGALCGSGLTRRLSEDEDTEVPADALRGSYEASAGARAGRYAPPWPVAAKRLAVWLGPDGLRKVRARVGDGREFRYLLPPLGDLRELFTGLTHVSVDITPN